MNRSYPAPARGKAPRLQSSSLTAMLPEPSLFPGVLPQGYALKHHRSRVTHDDLHLEIGGVLLSWMLFEHLSLDPTRKIRAIMQPSKSPRGMLDEWRSSGENSKSGAQLVWDHGTWQGVERGIRLSERQTIAALKTGYMEIAVCGQRIQGQYRLSKVRGPEWFIQKMDDEHAVRGHIWTDSASILTGRSLDQL